MNLLNLLKKSYVRILLYVLLFAGFGLLAYFGQNDLKICIFERLFQITCPGCGATRAFVQILSLNFAEAVELNPFFCFFIFPCALIVFIQGINCALTELLFKKKMISFAEFVLNSLDGTVK